SLANWPAIPQRHFRMTQFGCSPTHLAISIWPFIMHCWALTLSPSKFNVTSLQRDGWSIMQTATTSSIIGPPGAGLRSLVGVIRFTLGGSSRRLFLLQESICQSMSEKLHGTRNRAVAGSI